MNAILNSFVGAQQCPIPGLPRFSPPPPSPREDAVRALPAFSAARLSSAPEKKPSPESECVVFYASGEEEVWWALRWRVIVRDPDGHAVEFVESIPADSSAETSRQQ
jgi:hypothetical protein